MTFEEEMILRTEEVDEIVKSYLPEEKGLQKNLLEAMNYSVSVGGKRLRPMIMLESYRLFDGHGKVVEPFMAALEFIHSGSLVHDDMPSIDNDELRRGRPTTWKTYGESRALLAGDGLFVYAFEVAAKAFSLGRSPLNVGEAMGVLARKAGIFGMIGGEAIDVELTGKTLSEDEMYCIYDLKTGALLEAAFMIGAILAEASMEDVQIMRKIAKRIGFAFQIQDDVLDVTSSVELLGKPIHSDERNEKTTFVSLYGLEKARETVKSLTQEAVELLHQLPGENQFLEKIMLSLVEREK